MNITRTSAFTGITRTLDLPVTDQQLESYYGPRRLLIQDAFPNLTPDQREFIKLGVTEEEWNSVIGSQFE